MSIIKINFSPSAKQFQAYERLTDSTTSFVGYGGSAFSGKSYLLCYWLTIMSIGYPETAWGLCRKELVTLKKTTLLTLFKVFEESNIVSGKDYSYNQQLNYIKFSNGSYIFLIDTESKPSDPLFTRFGGYELTGAAVDESPETSERAIQILSTRVGRKNNDRYGITAKILETFNPDKGHVYMRYYKPWKDGIMPSSYCFIKALPADNPSPEVPAYIERIKATGDRVTIERLIGGNFEFDDDPLKLYDYDKILELFTNQHVQSIGNKYLTADVAYEGSDLFTVGIWSGLVETHTYAYDKVDETQVPNIIHSAKIKHAVPNSQCIYDADFVKTYVRQSASSGHLAGMVAFRNNAPAFDPAFFNIKAECAWKQRELMNKNAMYLADKTYRKQTIEEYEQIRSRFRYDDNEKFRLEKKADLKERLHRSPDHFDKNNMRMYFELKPKSNPNKSWMSGLR